MVRHAPVNTASDRIYGDDVDVVLGNQITQIRNLAQSLPLPASLIDRMQEQQQSAAKWYYSGVPRTRKSALAVLESAGMQNAPLYEDTGFKEQNFGDLIGKRHGDVLDHVVFGEGKMLVAAPPAGEDIPQLLERVCAAIKRVYLDALCAGIPNVVVFTHGGTIRAAHILLNALPQDRYIDLDTPPFSCHKYEISGDQ